MLRKAIMFVLLMSMVVLFAATRPDKQYYGSATSSVITYTTLASLPAAGYNEKTILIKNTSTTAVSINVKVTAVATSTTYRGVIEEELEDEDGDHVVALAQGETYLLYVTRAWATLNIYYASGDTLASECSYEAIFND